MSFNTYDQFKDAVSSEKLSLIFIYPRQGVTTFTSLGSNIWKKTVSNVISKLFNGSTELTAQTSSAVDANNPWFFDITTNELYYYTTSTLPDDDNVIAEYKLFFSNAPLNLSYDLDDLSEQVEYEPRVLTTVGFKSEIGADQKSISITGSGTVTLQNNDGHFDALFDTFIWENKLVEIYSYNRDLNPSDAQLQYKGFIVNKSFNLDTIKFKIQDSIFKLDTKVNLNTFNAPITATATLDLTNDIQLTSFINNESENGNILTLNINAAAANPTDTILIDVTGTAAAIVITVTPNDGTNNSAVPVNLTSFELVKYINTGTVASYSSGGALITKNITSTDINALRNNQTAINGDDTDLVNGGEGDGIVATFAGAVAGVGKSFIGNAKRRIYGKVDNLICRSITQVGDGLTVSGALTGNVYTKVNEVSTSNFEITGLYTKYTKNLIAGDVIRMGSHDYTVATIVSDTLITTTTEIIDDFNEIDMIFAETVARSGLVTGNIGSLTVTGSSGTAFVKEYAEGDLFTAGGNIHEIKFIESDTIMYLTEEPVANFTTVTHSVESTDSSHWLKLKGTATSPITTQGMTGVGDDWGTSLREGDIVKLNDDEYKVAGLNFTPPASNPVDNLFFTETDIIKDIVNGILYKNIEVRGFHSALGKSSTTTNYLKGINTLFLTEVAQGDTLVINSTKYEVEEVIDNTTILIEGNKDLEDIEDAKLEIINEEDAVAFSIIPLEISYGALFNREFFVADHAIKQGSSAITNMEQLNRFNVDDISPYEEGDTIVIGGDSRTIRSISSTQIEINTNASALYPIGTQVLKTPITDVFIEGERISTDNILSINNTSEQCTFTLSSAAEVNVAKNVKLDGHSFTFHNGSNEIKHYGPDDLSTLLQTQDHIKPRGTADSAHMRIIFIKDNIIKCSSSYTGSSTGRVAVDRKRPIYITDKTNVTINCFGKTKDGESNGELIRTGADVVEDLLKEIGLSGDLNADTFTQASIDNNMMISLALPVNITSNAPKIKDIIGVINGSIYGSLSLAENAKLSYFINNADRVDSSTLTNITDYDVIKWSYIGKNTNSYEKVLGLYRFVDFDSTINTNNNSSVSVISSKVQDYDISNKDITIDLVVYEDNDAKELAQRFLYNNEQTLLELKITTDLRYSDVKIGDRITVSFNRLSNQTNIGDNIRVFFVTGVKKDYNSVELKMSDLGNLFNRSAAIADAGAADYSAATNNEKRFGSFITDDNGIVTGFDDSKGTNLIS